MREIWASLLLSLSLVFCWSHEAKGEDTCGHKLLAPLIKDELPENFRDKLNLFVGINDEFLSKVGQLPDESGNFNWPNGYEAYEKMQRGDAEYGFANPALERARDQHFERSHAGGKTSTGELPESEVQTLLREIETSILREKYYFYVTLRNDIVNSFRESCDAIRAYNQDALEYAALAGCVAGIAPTDWRALLSRFFNAYVDSSGIPLREKKILKRVFAGLMELAKEQKRVPTTDDFINLWQNIDGESAKDARNIFNLFIRGPSEAIKVCVVDIEWGQCAEKVLKYANHIVAAAGTEAIKQAVGGTMASLLAGLKCVQDMDEGRQAVIADIQEGNVEVNFTNWVAVMQKNRFDRYTKSLLYYYSESAIAEKLHLCPKILSSCHYAPESNRFNKYCKW